MRRFDKLKLILIIINLALVLGIVWVFVKYTDYTETDIVVSEDTDYTEVIKKTENTEVDEEGTEVIDNKIDEENSNITIQQYDNDLSLSTLNSEINKPELLPGKINLNVPFTSQAPEKNWDEPWQDACEEAAVLMLDAFYKSYGLSPLFSKDEILKMVAWEEKNGWGTSISADKVKELGEWFLQIQKHKNNLSRPNVGTKTQKHIRIVEDPSVEEIKKYVAGGDPVLVLAYGKVLPNPHFRNGGPEYHALVIRGYDNETGEFITNDPGTQFGKNFRYKYNDLMEAIHDWNNGNVEEGGRVVLVIDN